jgi:hypothetical protein
MSSEPVCLHCEINEVIREHIDKTKEEVDLSELVARATESLVDLILLGPEEEWGNLLAEGTGNSGTSVPDVEAGLGDGRNVGQRLHRSHVEPRCLPI